MTKQIMKTGDEFVTVYDHGQGRYKVTWRINEYGMPQIINREDDRDGVSQ